MNNNMYTTTYKVLFAGIILMQEYVVITKK